MTSLQTKISRIVDRINKDYMYRKTSKLLYKDSEKDSIYNILSKDEGYKLESILDNNDELVRLYKKYDDISKDIEGLKKTKRELDYNRSSVLKDISLLYNFSDNITKIVCDNTNKLSPDSVSQEIIDHVYSIIEILINDKCKKLEEISTRIKELLNHYS